MLAPLEEVTLTCHGWSFYQAESQICGFYLWIQKLVALLSVGHDVAQEPCDSWFMVVFDSVNDLVSDDVVISLYQDPRLAFCL